MFVMDSGVLLIALASFGAGVLLVWGFLAQRSASRFAELRAAAERSAGECAAAGREVERVVTELRGLRQQLDAEAQRRAVAETELRTARESLEALEGFAARAQGQLEGTYAKLSQDALKGALEQLSAQIKPQLEGTRGEISSTLDAKKVEIEALMQPLRQMLEKYQAELGRSERERVDAYGKLVNQIGELRTAQTQARDAAHKLEHALRNPGVRGAWGEKTLRNCIELAGMANYCDFFEQQSFDDEDGNRLRPDVVVRLPQKRFIPIDSKAPIDAWLEAANESDEAKRKTLLDLHARNLRRHIDGLSKRRYQENVGESLDFTIMFIGGEQFLASALTTDPMLFEYAAEKNVVLASPTVLLPLLRAVATGWRAEKTEESARRVLTLGRELADRFSTMFSHFSEVGGALTRATTAYNAALRSAESRLLPKARELAELTDARKDVPEAEQVVIHTVEPPRLTVSGDDEPVS